MKKIRKIKPVFISVGIFLAVALIVILVLVSLNGNNNGSVVLTVAVIRDNNVKDYSTNYYTKWLEQKTGYDIRFEYITSGYEEEYIFAMLTADTGSIDMIMLPSEQAVLSEERLSTYIQKGYFKDLSEYLDGTTNLESVTDEYGLAGGISDNNAVYFFPNINTARTVHNMQVMWINHGWLNELGLSVPRTAEELKNVLVAFKEQDPNGNGIADELPLISCEQEYSTQSYNFILNGFTKNNPFSLRTYTDNNGKIRLSPIQNEFRNGLSFCNFLYENKLIEQSCFGYTERQLMELVNSDNDVVGAFTSGSVSDVIYSNCSDVLARYTQISPLITAEGEQNAVWVSADVNIGGFIPENSQHPDEAFKLAELMLSEEASLIAAFGEENTDWKYSDNGDLSTYGTSAVITTINYLNGTIQNKNYNRIGPYVLDEKYANGVTWNGNNSLVEYIDARAVRAYEEYYFFVDEAFHRETDNENCIEAREWLDGRINDFITGEKDINADYEWDLFTEEYSNRLDGIGVNSGDSQ